MDTFEAYLSPQSSSPSRKPYQHTHPLEIEKRLERITSNFKKENIKTPQSPEIDQISNVSNVSSVDSVRRRLASLGEQSQQFYQQTSSPPFDNSLGSSPDKHSLDDDDEIQMRSSPPQPIIDDGASSDDDDDDDEERPFFQVTELDIVEATKAMNMAKLSDNGQPSTPEIVGNPGFDGVVDEDNSIGSDESLRGDCPDNQKGVTSPFQVSKAEEEYEEMLLSPAQRNRIRNKRRRKVFVAVRVRPFLSDEIGKDKVQHSSLAVRGDSLLLVNPEVLPGAPAELIADMVLAGSEANMDMADWARPFEFGACLWSMGKENFCDQPQVYDCLGKQLVDSMFNGIHISAFAYGQTGSGKTYSMIGSDPLSLHIANKSTFGIIPNALIDMMDRAAKICAGGEEDISLRISVVEVYNDRLRDLLCPNRDERALKVREDPVNGPYAVGIEKVNVDLTEDKAERDDKLLQLLSVASAIRVTADNKDKYGGHAVSSRGHAIVNVDLTSNDITTRGQLVDLAGSERQSESTNQLGKRGRHSDDSSSAASSKMQQRTRERAEIGKSLSNLNVIINGLSKGDDPASLPFRECKMTWLLKQGLAMDAHVVMLGTVSPAASSYEETLQTLLYAERLQRMRSAIATPVKKMINPSVIRKVLSEPAQLLERIRAYQANVAPSQTSVSTMSQLPMSPNHFGLSPPQISTNEGGGSITSPSNGGKVNKTAMRGLEVSDPRQRLIRLTDYLNELANPGSSTKNTMPPPSSTRRQPPLSSSNTGPANTPSRNSLRARMLSENQSHPPPFTPEPQGNQTNDNSFSMHNPPSDAGRNEIAFLRHEHANLEMEMHTVKADRDVLELRLAESESDVKSLQLKVTELQREVSEMDALRARVAELKNLLAEQTQLTQDRQEEIQRLHGARLKAEERENELRREKEKAEAMAAMAAAEQAEMDRLDALTAAWYTWQSFIEDSELDRMRERLCLNAASPLRLEGRLTPEASPPATPPVSPPKDPHLESIHEVSGERDIGSPEDERNGGGGRYSSLSAAFDQS